MGHDKRPSSFAHIISANILSDVNVVTFSQSFPLINLGAIKTGPTCLYLFCYLKVNYLKMPNTRKSTKLTYRRKNLTIPLKFKKKYAEIFTKELI